MKSVFRRLNDSLACWIFIAVIAWLSLANSLMWGLSLQPGASLIESALLAAAVIVSFVVMVWAGESISRIRRDRRR